MHSNARKVPAADIEQKLVMGDVANGRRAIMYTVHETNGRNILDEV